MVLGRSAFCLLSLVLNRSIFMAWLSFALSAAAQIDLSHYSPAHPLKVMAIGDSITDDCSYNGAWRQYLQPLLQTNGYPFVFVGRQTSSPTRTFTQTRHEGYCGSVIAPPGMMTTPVHNYAGVNVYLLKIVADALTNMTPDLVLIVMGANDIGRARDPFHVATNDMPALLDLIFSNAPNAEIVLTKTTTLTDAVFGYNTNASHVPIYNGALQAMVNQRAAQGQRLSLADMYTAVDYATMFNSDHLHPNQVGLSAMAKEFFTRIQLVTLRSNLVATPLIPGGALWKYSDLGQDLGSDWKEPQYDDSSWSNGLARLGYGDSVAATRLSFGSDSKQKYTTTYFRSSFVVPEGIAFTNLDFRVSRQDGVVVWLNGQEAFRANLPGGQVTYTNLALKRVVGDAVYKFYSTNLIVSALPAGTNVIAVELHINSPLMPSIGFDMELLGTGYVIPPPSLSVSLAGDHFVLNWPISQTSSYLLFSTGNLGDPNGWRPLANIPQITNDQYVLTVAPEAGPRFFRLQKQ